ncbi:threonine dehydratase, catabolic [Geomicrobium sp. JCM 19037]|uniref:threonine ammonia-lyase n=1 Tax=Geomicrobium sp. JCM 19037 TaxID=1460634 RepID=UPI00045F3A62|nr:threonine/serine dehydratase [Geomicrobium sp. JCM 19037]GAK05048.1 threonine dehydratase, catabolic [Geomicrobium sp. JCM 19037]
MITVKELNEARVRLHNTVHVTPVLTSNTLNKQANASVYIKSEHLQKTGSFKIRGATNCVMQAKEQGAEHLIAASSGNHGQAVAYIARELGLNATIVIPEDANAAKEEAIRNYGAQVIHFGTTSEERIAHANELVDQLGATFIPPYDDTQIIAGQGTVGLEILSQVNNPEVVVVPVGGGGLISGVATAIKSIHPEVKVIGVEPVNADDTRRSLEQGERVSIDAANTIADGLRASTPGAMTFPIIQQHVDEIVTVSEEDIREAFVFYLSRMKQVIEPSGAATSPHCAREKLHTMAATSSSLPAAAT